MQLTVLGGCGAWPEAGGACSGYLVEHAGFRVLIDPGYAVLPRLLQVAGAGELDAVLISHGHPDHCADLNPLLRARAMADSPPAPLPVYAPAGALDAVLALDRPGMLDHALVLREFSPGAGFSTGPFDVRTWLLPHWLPNAGLRLTAGGASGASGASTLAYTGDSGPSPDQVELASGADIFLAEATHLELAGETGRFLSTPGQAGETAARAGAGTLILTHLWPGTDRALAVATAAASFSGRIEAAAPGLVV